MILSDCSSKLWSESVKMCLVGHFVSIVSERFLPETAARVSVPGEAVLRVGEDGGQPGGAAEDEAVQGNGPVRHRSHPVVLD